MVAWLDVALVSKWKDNTKHMMALWSICKTSEALCSKSGFPSLKHKHCLLCSWCRYDCVWSVDCNFWQGNHSLATIYLVKLPLSNLDVDCVCHYTAAELPFNWLTWKGLRQQWCTLCDGLWPFREWQDLDLCLCTETVLCTHPRLNEVCVWAVCLL